MTMSVAAGVAGLPAEYAVVTERLEAVGGQFRAAFVLRALARFVMLVLPVTLGMVFAAGIFTLVLWAKVAMVVGVTGIWVLAYARFLHRPVFHRPSYGEIARLVEQYAPAGGEPLDNALINAVLLAQDLETAPQRRTWIPLVLRELAGRLDGLPLAKSVPWRQPRNAWLAAAAVLAAAIVAVAWAPATFAHGLSVLLHPASFVPRQGAVRIVSVVPGNETVLAGQSVDFIVTVDSPGQKTVEAQLQIQFASGKNAAYPMLPFGGENTQYKRENVPAAEDMDYLIRAGDTQSERYHISVRPQIHVTRLEIVATPPAYTGLEKQVRSLAGKDATTAGKAGISAPLGSTIDVSVTLDVPASEMLLDVIGGSPMVMRVAGEGATFSATTLLKDSLQYALRVNDGANRTLHQFPDDANGAGTPSYYTIAAAADAPPAIAVTEPGKDIDAKPGDKVALAAQGTDDYGLSQIRLEVARNSEKEFHAVQTWPVTAGKDGKPTRAATVKYLLDLPADQYKFGDTLRYRFVATDNRDLTAVDAALTPQATEGQVFSINLNDTAAAAARSSKVWDELRKQLAALLDRQVALRKQAQGVTAGLSLEDVRKAVTPISEGQKALRADMAALARDFPFEPSMKLVQKALQVLSVEDAVSAVDRSADILLLSDTRTLVPLATRLRQHQSRIIDVLQTLLAISAADERRLAQVIDHEGGDIPNDARDAWKKLDEELKKFEKDQKAVIDATADLAKKPKDQFDQNDLKKLGDLAAVEDKWEKFLNNRLADMSKLAQQDQANVALLEEVVQMKVELAMARNALDQKATEIATPLEENGLEDAKQLTTHIERWLQQQPDRISWQMEEPVTQNDPAMAELPKQLQDMVGELMDKEEDLTQEMESLASKWADSLDKGAGWDAMDGPISNMSAQGVTGNQLPKAMEIQGRSGEGREGQSSGEMVGASAEGKEGRRTPTRLTNDPFSSGQVDDKSKLPVGGATGGGKKGGLGGEGLEGPSPQSQQDITQRLAGQQASIRNEAERLALQMHAANFDNFKLIESNVYLKKSADALQQYHYQTALYYQQQAVQSLNTAKVLASGQVHVIADTSATASEKTQKDIESALNGAMPKGYGDPVKAYFEKLATDGGR